MVAIKLYNVVPLEFPKLIQFRNLISERVDHKFLHGIILIFGVTHFAHLEDRGKGAVTHFLDGLVNIL